MKKYFKPSLREKTLSVFVEKIAIDTSVTGKEDFFVPGQGGEDEL